MAEQLHATQPEHYKDPNHKPEMAVALTDFEAMCGFRPLPEILQYLSAYPELADIIGQVNPHEDTSEYLKNIFANFMQASDELVNEKIDELTRRLSATNPPFGSTDELIIRLNVDFPNDRGALCPLILNVISLKAGACTHRVPNTYRCAFILLSIAF